MYESYVNEGKSLSTVQGENIGQNNVSQVSENENHEFAKSEGLLWLSINQF